MFIPELHDEDSVFFNDSYTGPSERELMGGCNRCGGMDDCYCPTLCSSCKGKGCDSCDGAGEIY